MEPFIKINGRAFPYPKRGLELITSTFVDSARNTAGEVVGQKVGRDQYKVNRCEWPVLTAGQWSTMLSMLNDFFVTVTFPDQVSNTWRSLKMYPGDRAAEPYWLDEETGLPTMYRNCRVNLIDAGYKDTTPPPVPAQYRLQSKTVAPSSTDKIVVRPDSPEYYGLSEVVVIKSPGAGGLDTSDATARPSDIVSGKVAYAKGDRLVGTLDKNVWTEEAQKIQDGIIDKSITSITNTGVKKIGIRAFTFCASLTNADFPATTDIGMGAFDNCTSLKTINFPVVTEIGPSAFTDCWSLAKADFPMATIINASAFNYCESMTSINFPRVTSIGRSAFQDCSALKIAEFPAVTSIGPDAFRYCSSLKVLRLSGPKLCKATGDPGINKTCEIHIPASLAEQYGAEANWSKYASQFVLIGGI